jgi:hypothetical protein
MAKKKPCKRRDSSGDLRNYCKETAYESRPEQRKNRSERNQARREMGLKVGDPREVDHIKPMAAGGGNGKDNLRVTSRSFNRKRAAKARA